MKKMTRQVAALVAVGSAFALSACTMGTPKEAADPSEAMTEEAEEAGEGEEPKKALEGMKGDRMEKAGAEE